MRGSFIIILLSIGFFLLSASAEGANWELITTDKDGNLSVYVDTESIRHISKTVVRAWIKIILKNPEPFGSKKIVETLDYEEHDCVEMKASLLEIYHKYSDGTTASVTAKEKEFLRYIRPDTIESVIFNYLCKKGK